MQFSKELEAALVEALSHLKKEEGLVFSLAAGRDMLALLIELKGPSATEDFLAFNNVMRGQFLLVCSPENKWFFQECHPAEKLSLDGLVDQWTAHPDRVKSAAAKYREHRLLPS
jgi:hypothetical protein